MTQLLQARGWYGVFLHAQPLEPRIDGMCPEDVIERVMVYVHLRPLIGWTSVEGGFQGLYYHEQTRRLQTGFKLVDGWPPNAVHLGDICVDEVATIRAILLKTVLDGAKEMAERWKTMYEMELSADAKTLIEDRRLPIPQETTCP